jgi:hypothetical protein
LIRKIGPSAVPEIDFEDIVQNGESILSLAESHMLMTESQAVQCPKVSSTSSATAAA